jgi:hypothetical protein
MQQGSVPESLSRRLPKLLACREALVPCLLEVAEA